MKEENFSLKIRIYMMEEELNGLKEASPPPPSQPGKKSGNLNDTDMSEIDDDPFSHSSDLLNNDYGGKKENVNKAANKFIENRFYPNYDSELENEELENLNKLVSITFCVFFGDEKRLNCCNTEISRKIVSNKFFGYY